MKRKTIINLLFGIVAFLLLTTLAASMFVEPLIRRKIEATVNEKNKNFTVKIGEVNISPIKSTIEFKKIIIVSKQLLDSTQFIKGEITSVNLKGIHLLKALFVKDIDILEVVISNCNISGRIPFLGGVFPSIVAPLNIRIGSLIIDNVNLTFKNALNAQLYSVKEGVLKFYDLQIGKQSKLSLSSLKHFDFDADECFLVSADSMYSYKINDAKYSTSSNTLKVNKFSIQPNYKDYDFTSRYKFQTNRIEADFTNISAHNFNAVNYFISKDLVSSYIEIGKLDMNVFRDKRKEFKHVIRPTFQDMIYNYPSFFNIDSIDILNGNIIFTVHAEKAQESGRISFNEIHARIYKITNDTIYKTKNDYLELNADALLMGKGKLVVLLKSKLFDDQNTFTVNGTLAELDVRDLNPIIKFNSYINATTGKLDAMNFQFTANNYKATGKLIVLYHGLNVALKNKRTEDKNDFAKKFITAIANTILLNSNPIPGKEVRVGVIDYKRDPERFLFNYCFKSILSGIEFSLVKRSKKVKN